MNFYKQLSLTMAFLCGLIAGFIGRNEMDYVPSWYNFPSIESKHYVPAHKNVRCDKPGAAGINKSNFVAVAIDENVPDHPAYWLYTIDIPDAWFVTMSNGKTYAIASRAEFEALAGVPDTTVITHGSNAKTSPEVRR